MRAFPPRIPGRALHWRLLSQVAGAGQLLHTQEIQRSNMCRLESPATTRKDGRDDSYLCESPEVPKHLTRLSRRRRVRLTSFIDDRIGDRIVKEAIRMVLEAVYEPYFLVYSHGYRPGLGEHSALKEIRRWVGISWFLKFRLQSCDENKMKKFLTAELQQLVDDDMLLDIIRKSVRQNFYQQYQKYQRRTSRLGRLLTNIYLHQFDLSVARNISLYKRGDVPTVVANDGSELKSDLYKRQGVRHILIANMPDYRRLWYVRHGTEFMMGFIGTREEASDIFHDAKHVIETIGFKMNNRKSGHVADSMQNPASFLGMRIVCEDPTPDRENPHKVEWETRMEKLQGIREEDRRKRMMRKYVETGKYTLSRAADETFELKTKALTGLKEVIGHLRETIVGPEYRNIYHVMCPQEILLNKRTQRVFPPEVTEAAKDLEEALKRFVNANKAKDVVTVKRKEKKPKKEPLAVPTMTPPVFYAPIRNVKFMLNNSMFLCRGRPGIHPYLARKTEIEIVEEFARVANSLLNYYKCTTNLERVKRIVDYNLRFSCLRTLGERHKTTAKAVKRIFTTDLIVPVEVGNQVALRRPYPSPESIAKHSQGFLARDNPSPPWKVLQMYSLQRL